MEAQKIREMMVQEIKLNFLTPSFHRITEIT